LEDALDGDQENIVPAVVKNVIVETKFTPQASERLKGKSAYEVTIISDIGSATVTAPIRSRRTKVSRGEPVRRQPPPIPGVFPDYPTPVARNTGGEMVMMPDLIHTRVRQ
jgi:hypothetical protein